jgi:hypothetical protein
LTAYRTSAGSVEVVTGCFTGTLEELKQAVDKTHASNSKAHKQYNLFIALIKGNFEESKDANQ